MSNRKIYSLGRNIKKHFDFIIADFFMVQLSYFLAVYWYYYSFGSTLEFGNLYRTQCLILVFCFLVSVVFGQPYKNILKRDKWQEVSATINHAISMAIIDIVLMYLMKYTSSSSRLTFAATWTIYVFFELFFRLFWKRFIRGHIINHKNNRRQIIILTDRKRSALIKNNLGFYILRNYDLTAIFLKDYDPSIDAGIAINEASILGNEDKMIEYATHNWVDEVILDVPGDTKLLSKMKDIFATMNIPVHQTIALLSEQDNMTSGTLNVEKMGNYVLLTQETREISPIQIFLKRMLDLVGGIVGSLFAVIIMIIVGPIIKMKSSGPIIFAQDRIGKNGKTFKMYKIRSMYMDAEEKKAALMSQNKMNGLMFKMDDDPRIIGSEKKDENGKPKGIGNFIRNTSLDEFPQFFNVLKGDMSLVGTRPPTVDEWNQYIPEYRKRLSMRPGITGLWQISGRSDITNFEDIVKLDAEYIDTWTVGTDLKIIMKTIGKVLKKEGAE